jgi:hypothetical protein
MSTQEKIIARQPSKPKPGVLEHAKQLGNVSQACKMMAIAEIAFTDSRSCMKKEVKLLCGK